MKANDLAIQVLGGSGYIREYPLEQLYRGKLQAARFYIDWELPEIEPQLALLEAGNRVPFEMQQDWF